MSHDSHQQAHFIHVLCGLTAGLEIKIKTAKFLNIPFFQLEERKTSSVLASEDGPLLEEFRNAFQEVSQWIDSAEAKLLESRKSEERALGREIEEWRPKVGNLRSMAEKLVQIFVGQKNDVEPEMKNLGQRSEPNRFVVLLYIFGQNGACRKET